MPYFSNWLSHFSEGGENERENKKQWSSHHNQSMV